MTEFEHDENEPAAVDAPSIQDRWWYGPPIALMGLLAVLAVAFLISFLQQHHQSDNSSHSVELHLVNTASPSVVSTPPSSAPLPAVPARTSARPTPTHAHVTQHTHAGPTAAAVTTAPSQGGQQSYPVGRQSSAPVPVTPPVAAPPVTRTTASSRPAYTTPAPKPHPTPKPTPYKAHFVSVGKPAAFANIPGGGAAQAAAEDCASGGSCNVTGLQWGGSCSMPPYRGDTAGAQHSGWAMWQRGPDDCTWAMAVSSF